jgi:hypothetical protein
MSCLPHCLRASHLRYDANQRTWGCASDVSVYAVRAAFAFFTFAMIQINAKCCECKKGIKKQKTRFTPRLVM